MNIPFWHQLASPLRGSDWNTVNLNACFRSVVPSRGLPICGFHWGVCSLNMPLACRAPTQNMKRTRAGRIPEVVWGLPCTGMVFGESDLQKHSAKHQVYSPKEIGVSLLGERLFSDNYTNIWFLNTLRCKSKNTLFFSMFVFEKTRIVFPRHPGGDPRCPQMLPDVPAPRGSQMFPDAPRWFRCSQMPLDAPRCSQTFKNRCYQYQCKYHDQYRHQHQ
jgi:hypothetical protein